MGLDVYLHKIEEGTAPGPDGLEPDGDLGVEFESVKNPHPLFRVGYWRSSYNGSGINGILEDALGEGHNLWSLIKGMNPDDRYFFEPNWPLLRRRAVALLKKWEAHLATYGDLRVAKVHLKPFGVASGAEALERFKAEKAKKNDPNGFFRAYSNREGEFHLDGWNIKALVPAEQVGLFPPSFYVVFDAGEDGEENFYTTALKIVVETCDYVLASGERHGLVWSY